MVRNYIRKTQKGSAYSHVTLKLAVAEVAEGRKSLKAAAREYKIPPSTLCEHVKGKHGIKSDSRGRSTAIPRQMEDSLAAGLITMEKWGFGLSRHEVLQVVADFVSQNSLVTPFKNGIPGEDWFLGFKRRHNLSIKKPQSVEYARKKMTDPFVTNDYFDLLKKILDDLQLTELPERIWNMDETSFCMDPCKTKVVGKRESVSTRTTSGPGRDNTTVLSGCSATGQKLPPLIVFKGKATWDQRFAPSGQGYPGTKYSASPNGWMETDIFANFFETTFVPALGDARPVLLIYDGHSTHVGPKVIQIAIRENITILKLPPHTSHLLQPLDLSVFKSLKNTWDAKLVQWQRTHFGQKLPKKEFSILLGETWSSVPERILSNGFRKAGIYPYDKNVLSPSQFDPSALKRWNKRNEVDEEPKTGPNFEDILLATVKQSKNPVKNKRTRVAPGAEVISTEEMLAKMAEPKPKPAKTQNKNSKYRHATTQENQVDRDAAEPVAVELDPPVNVEKRLDLSEGKWVLVKYQSKRDTLLFYIGFIVSKNHRVGVGEANWNVKFLKAKDGHFVWPEIEDLDTIDEEDVVQELPVPSTDRRGQSLKFSVNFDEYKLS